MPTGVLAVDLIDLNLQSPRHLCQEQMHPVKDACIAVNKDSLGRPTVEEIVNRNVKPSRSCSRSTTDSRVITQARL